MPRFARVVTIALLAAAPATLLAQGTFEGVITARMQGMGGNSADVTYMIKGDQFRTDMSGRGMSMYILYDAGKSSTLMVMPAQRMYMDMSSTAMENQGDRKVPEMKWTGKTETSARREFRASSRCDDIMTFL